MAFPEPAPPTRTPHMAAAGRAAAVLTALLTATVAAACTTTPPPPPAGTPTTAPTAAVDSEKLLDRAKAILNNYGATGWQELQPPTPDRCVLPGETDGNVLAGTQMYHAVKAEQLPDDNWDAAKADIVAAAAQAGLTEVVSPLRREGTHFLDLLGPADAKLSIRITSGHTALSVTSTCLPAADSSATGSP